jgi:hypothetical protein
VTESQDYAIELLDKDGIADPEPSKFASWRGRTRPPQVTITVPGERRAARRGPRPSSRTASSTTSGIRAWADGEGEREGRQVWRFPSRRSASRSPRTTLDLKALGVGAGDYVEYFPTATTNKEPRAAVRASAAYIVSIQSTLPLLTFADAHPDVRRRESTAIRGPEGIGRAEEPTACARRTTREGRTRHQEPTRARARSRRTVAKLEEKKPDSKKSIRERGGRARRTRGGARRRAVEAARREEGT